MADKHYGATPEEWTHFDLVLGLGEDLLPVVSDPTAKISPDSKMRALGKTPSHINRSGFAAGIAEWTSKRATSDEIDRWSQNPDLGICVQTRRVRAIDIDVEDFAKADAIREFIETRVGGLPLRTRANSGKLLLAFEMPGDFTKRSFKCDGGLVEFLANGQQFIACGTHPSGARYEWGVLPSSLPTLTPEEFEALWSALVEQFAIEPSTTSERTQTKAEKVAGAAQNDPVATALFDRGVVVDTESDGRLHIECPFNEDHERESDASATTYWPAHTGGYARGHFKCLHTPCAGRTDTDFLRAFNLEDDPRDDFEAIEPDEEALVKPVRFLPILDRDFKSGPPPEWLIKDVLPHAELGVVYGASGAGKSFLVLDMAAAIALGRPDWCGKKVKKGTVVYIAAEGASGFRNRLNAYCSAHSIEEIGVHIIPDAPNFMQANDVVDLINAIRPLRPDLVIVDTLAQVSSGADENSGQDMGRVLGHCGLINRITRAMVLPIHHSGKDAAKGARGWSGIKGALNVEIEVSRFDNNRTATITKMRDGGGEGDAYGFTLTTVPVGMDADGDVITSCVVEHGGLVGKPERKKKGPHEAVVWQAALDLQKVGGGLPGVEEVISAAVDQTPFDPGANKRDRRREVIGRALQGLIDAGKLKVHGGGVAIVE